MDSYASTISRTMRSHRSKMQLFQTLCSATPQSLIAPNAPSARPFLGDFSVPDSYGFEHGVFIAKGVVYSVTLLPPRSEFIGKVTIGQYVPHLEFWSVYVDGEFSFQVLERIGIQEGLARSVA